MMQVNFIKSKRRSATNSPVIHPNSRYRQAICNEKAAPRVFTRGAAFLDLIRPARRVYLMWQAKQTALFALEIRMKLGFVPAPQCGSWQDAHSTKGWSAPPLSRV